MIENAQKGIDTGLQVGREVGEFSLGAASLRCNGRQPLSRDPSLRVESLIDVDDSARARVHGRGYTEDKRDKTLLLLPGPYWPIMQLEEGSVCRVRRSRFCGILADGPLLQMKGYVQWAGQVQLWPKHGARVAQWWREVADAQGIYSRRERRLKSSATTMTTRRCVCIAKRTGDGAGVAE